MDEMNVGDLSYLDLLIPSLLADAEEQDRAKARAASSANAISPAGAYINNNNNNTQNHSVNNVNANNNLNKSPLSYAPLNPERIEFMARQLESGIDPYISAANGASMVAPPNNDGIMAVAMSTGPDSLLTENEEGSFVYNSTPYDNMLYDGAIELDFDTADFNALAGPNGPLRYSPARNSNASANDMVYRTNEREKENMPLRDGPTTLTWQTPKKPEPQNTNTPSTIVLTSSAKQQRTILRNSIGFYESQTPIRAVKTNSFTKLIAEASDTSPAKGRFISTARRASTLGGAHSQPPRVLAPPTDSNASSSFGQPIQYPAPAQRQQSAPAMSFSMSQFQVQLSTNMSAKSGVRKPKKPKKSKKIAYIPGGESRTSTQESVS